MKNENKNKISVTAEGLAKIRTELDELKNNKRPQVVDRLALARSQGDLSENNEYAAAREELAFVDGRIEELEEIIANASITVIQKSEGTVCLGCKVKVKIDGTEAIYEIVGEFEADPTMKKVSAGSPLGKALLGKKTGDEVTFEAPAGQVVYKIVDIG
jgi:transcription elongation factor GreA